MVIDCIDMTDPAYGASRIGGLNASCVTSTQLQFYGMSNGVARMVSSVANAASAGAIDAVAYAAVQPSGRAELWGCSIGADGAGRTLLINLQNLWNVNV